MPETSPEIKIFYSYSHNDETLRKKLDDHLAFLKHDSVIVWYDREIIAGHVLNETIQKELNEADIILLLVSSSFLSSFYCYEIEMKRAMERHEAKEAVVVPVLLSDCVWQKAPFAKLLMTPYDAKPINNPKHWATEDEALTNVAKELEKTVNWVKENKKSKKDEIVNIRVLNNISENKLSDYPKPGNLFTGRREKIKEFKKTFESSRITAIEGLGGAGKTEFAAKCIEEIIEDKSKIVWLNGSSQSNFDVFVETAGYGDVLKGENKTDLAVYSGLKDLIERDERIIFWDNFNDYTDESFSKFLSFACPYLQKSSIILITKTVPLIEKITSIPIVKIEGLDTDAFEYAKKLKDSNLEFKSITDEGLKEICEGVEGHPLAIELSILLMGYGKSANDILLHLPEYTGVKKVEEFSKRLFLDIFNHQNTSIEERECFLKCSVFKGRISENEIKFLFDGKDVFVLLTKLIDKLLLANKEGFYEMHPLVRSFSYDMLSNKTEVHKKAADCFILLREKETLNPSLEEKIFYHLSKAEEWGTIADSIESTGRTFIQKGQLGLIYEFITKLNGLGIVRPVFDIFYGDIAEIQGKWDEALKFYNQARTNESDKKIKAEGIIKYGEMIHRQGNIKEALPFYEEAYEFSKHNGYRNEEARAINDIGIVYELFGDLDKAHENYNEGLKIRIEINDKEGIATSVGNIGSIYKTQGNLDDALNCYEQSLKISEKIGNKEGIATSLVNIGTIHDNQGYLEKALDCHQQSLAICEEIGSKQGIATSLGSIGNIYSTQGDLEKALYYHEHSLKISEEIGNKRGIAASLGNIGGIYNIPDDWRKALNYHEQSLKISEKIGNKQGIAASLGNIGSVYYTQRDLSKALNFNEKSLKIKEEIGDKLGLATSLGKIGNIYNTQGDLEKALYYNEQSLKIKEEIGNKIGIATSLCSIGAIYANDKKREFDLALINLFKSLSLGNKIGVKDITKVATSCIINIRNNKEVGLSEFKNLAKQALKQLEPEMQKYIPMQELLNEPVIASPKVGRNDPCPCGSGLKYKKCHGKDIS